MYKSDKFSWFFLNPPHLYKGISLRNIVMSTENTNTQKKFRTFWLHHLHKSICIGEAKYSGNWRSNFCWTSPRAECCMAYSAPEEVVPTNRTILIFLHTLMHRLFHRRCNWLQQRPFRWSVNFPNSKVPRVGPDASIEERITFKQKLTQVLQGMAVTVVCTRRPRTWFNCCIKIWWWGCSAIDVTLKQGVETTLKFLSFNVWLTKQTIHKLKVQIKLFEKWNKKASIWGFFNINNDNYYQYHL